MKNILLVLLIIISFVLISKWREPELREHNKYQCAVYGYQEDCKTPLAVQDRLK